MNLDKCCFCGDLVIGLRGQDTVLDTFLLHDDDTVDREILGQHRFGEAHFSCLMKSPFRRQWTKRLLENYVNVRKFRETHQGSNFRIISNERASEQAVVFDGRWYWISRKHQWTRQVDNYLFPVTQDLNMDLTEFSKVEDRLRGEVSLHGYAHLCSLIDGLGVRKRLFEDLGTRSGKLELKPSGKPHWLTFKASYSVSMEVEVFNALRL